MYSVDDMRTPRDRVDEQFLRRLMENGEMENHPECDCRGCEKPEERRDREQEREVETMQRACGCRDVEMAQGRNLRTREAENPRQDCGCRDREMNRNPRQDCGCKDREMNRNSRQDCGCRDGEMNRNRRQKLPQ